MTDKRLGFGLMRLPLLNSEDESSIDLETMKKMVDAFLERGFTYFDTAWMYCDFKSEEAARKALVERYPRGSFTLATKLHGAFFDTLEGRDEIFNKQLENCGVDYFDYYLLHDVGRDQYKKYTDLDCFSWLLEKKRQGLVRHVGFSFHDGPEMLDEVLTAHPEMEFVQLQINYLDWESRGVQSRACYETAVRHGKKVIVMEPVRGGTLAHLPKEAEDMLRAMQPDRSIPSWAIRFAAQPENVMMVLSGMSNMEQMLDNLDTMDRYEPLTAGENEAILKTVDIIEKSMAIPCTGCSYCTTACAMQIPIPRYFALYNMDKYEQLTGGWRPQKEYYDRLTQRSASPDECAECGACEEICPQKLEIRELLKDVSSYFASKE